MKTNTLTFALLGLLALSALGSAYFALAYRSSIHHARELQGRMDEMVRTRNTINALAQDALAYSQRNPAIDQVLQQVGLKPSGQAPAAAKPAPAPVPAAGATKKR